MRRPRTKGRGKILTCSSYSCNEFGFFQVRDAPPIHHVVIQGDRIRAFGFSTNPAAANRARAPSTANSTTDGASEEQNLQLPPSPTSQNEDGGELKHA